jgi:hypothetical protein
MSSDYFALSETLAQKGIGISTKTLTLRNIYIL